MSLPDILFCMILPIICYDNPILRKKAAKVTEITDEIRTLIRDMEETRASLDGLGISAPQVGKSLAIFIASPPVQEKDGSWGQKPSRVFINPRLSHPSAQCWSHEEGCMSIPKIYISVTRPVSITVTAQDIDGKEFTEELVGWDARVIMHENDHLNGVLMIDRIPAEQRKMLEPQLRKINQQYNLKK
jgi:peptide deformylase